MTVILACDSGSLFLLNLNGCFTILWIPICAFKFCFGMEYSEHYLMKWGQGVILCMHLVRKGIGLWKILRWPVAIAKCVRRILHRLRNQDATTCLFWMIYCLSFQEFKGIWTKLLCKGFSSIGGFIEGHLGIILPGVSHWFVMSQWLQAITWSSVYFVSWSGK